MICIFCMGEHPPTSEHVIPLAIGGTITMNRVCRQCNSEIGARVDSALVDFFTVRIRRADLGVGGRSGPPSKFDLLEGTHSLVGERDRRIQVKFNGADNRLELKSVYHSENVVLPDGTSVRRVTIDAEEKEKIPKIINRERKRLGLPPLSDEEIQKHASEFSVETINNPQINVRVTTSFAFLSHAMYKIAYEAAFLWLGERYLEDPLAEKMRTAILKNDPASTDILLGGVKEFDQNGVFKFWKTVESRHIIFAHRNEIGIFIAIRIFDLFEAFILVTENPDLYVPLLPDQEKLRFIIIDAVTKETVNTSFSQEKSRVILAMIGTGRTIPVDDPIDAKKNVKS